MQLYLYRTNDLNNVVDKTLTNETILNINLKRDTDILRPKIPLAKSGSIDLKTFNYAYMPDLNRYYFINVIESINNNVDVLYLEVDVLMSYSAEIKTGIKTYIADISPTYKADNIYSANSDKNTVIKIDSDVALQKTQSIIITTLGV